MSLKFNQKGLAPVAIIAIVVVVALVGGYFLLNKGGGTPSIPGVPAIGLNPNCKFNDPDLCKFINNFKQTKDYSVKSTTSDKSGMKMEMTFEGSGDDKSHMMNSENGKESYNVITIGDTTYTKDYSDNKWWKQVSAKASPEAGNDFKSEIDKSDQPEDKTTYKKIGMEACESMQCFKYQVIDPTSSDTTQYIWFDNRDYQLRKMRVEGKDGSVTESVFAYSGVNISAPSPTKDAKPDQVILPGGGVSSGAGGLTPQQIQDMEKMSQQAPSVDDTSNSDTNPSE